MAENGSVEMSTNIHWSHQLEDYLASTGEKAHCLSWVHKRAQAMYSTRKTYIELPAIVLASLVGFLSVGSSTIFAGETTGSSIVLGGASLVVSVLNTVGAYFGWARRAEGHRISSMHYAKLYRTLYAELCLPRDERMFPQDILKYVKEQYDRLAEISPLVPPEIILEFQRKFAHETDISKPEETNGLEKIHVYRAETKVPTPSVSRLQSAATSSNPTTAGLFYKAAKTLMARNKSFEGASEILSPTLPPIQEEPQTSSIPPAQPSPPSAEAVQEALREKISPKIASMVSFWKDPGAKAPQVEVPVVPTRSPPPPPDSEAPPSE